MDAFDRSPAHNATDWHSLRAAPDPSYPVPVSSYAGMHSHPVWESPRRLLWQIRCHNSREMRSWDVVQARGIWHHCHHPVEELVAFPPHRPLADHRRHHQRDSRSHMDDHRIRHHVRELDNVGVQGEC